MLRDQIDNKNNSWAIRWHVSLFLKNKFCLQPTRSLVKNIGFDGSGEHCGVETIKQNPTTKIRLKKLNSFQENFLFYVDYNNYKLKDELNFITKNKINIRFSRFNDLIVQIKNNNYSLRDKLYFIRKYLKSLIP